MNLKQTLMTCAAALGLLCLGSSPAPHSNIDPNPLEGVVLDAMVLEDGAYVQHLQDGRKVVFTVDPALQGFTEELFDRYQIPAAAAVILNSKTGRVLAMAQKRRAPQSAGMDMVALDASPPAASLFKIVTTAALLEAGLVTIGTQTCYHGGAGRIDAEHLVDNKEQDTACVSLATALGKSANAVFAKLSDSLLEGTALLEAATRFGFNQELPFDVPLQPSIAEIPGDRLERARTSAGFWHSHLSPLHAAMILQSIAQDGAMLRPYIVDSVVSEEGAELYRGEPHMLSRTVSASTSKALIEAMKTTVTRGTARKGFRNDAGQPYLPGISVAGKTGTLTGETPYRAYSWFAGLAPADDPEIAIAVLVVNEPKWRIKSATTAALILRKYFEGNGK